MRSALLIPCYNATRYLPRLRAQLSALTRPFDEVLLADDGSQDNTAKVAEDLGFRVLRLPKNGGPGAARNALARATDATWIHFHDVDDEIAPSYLDRVSPYVSDGCDAVYHFTDFIDEQTRALHIRWQFNPTEFAADPARTALLNPLPTMSSFLRRESFLAVNGFNEKLRCFEDGDLHFRIAAAGGRIRVCPEVLEFSLRHNGGAGADQRYCFQCRLEFLQGYANEQPARLRSAIAQEAEKAATMLLRFGDKTAAQRAVDLATKLGRIVPETRNVLIRALRPAVPAIQLLRWQDKWRQTRAGSSSSA